MKVLYDHQIFGSQVYGGISRYFFELMKQFKEIGEPEFELSLKYSKNHYLNSARLENGKAFFDPGWFKFRVRRKSIINKAKSRRAILGHRFDIFHPTYFDPYFLDYIGDKPYILTIYDMTHEVFSDIFSAKDKTAENKKVLAQKAAKIIAISENTKNDIIKYYGFDDKKIAVTYLAGALSQRGFRSEITIPERYIYFVGARGVYKNFEFFVKSVNKIMAADKQLHLVCAGGREFSDSEKGLFRNLGIEDRVHFFSVTDEVMAWLYQKAVAFVFPSLYEGFGIPVLEAFSCGCPTILSNTSSLPEVGGDAAVYFDPKNEISICEAVARVIYDRQLQDELRDKGLKQLRRFSWEKTAMQTYKIYRSIL
jgi:glycosyltransferase involved in cell wall biosynthesis